MSKVIKWLAVALAVFVGLLVFIYVIVPIIGLIFSGLWLVAGAVAFLAKVLLFVGLVFFVLLLIVRLIVRGLEMVLY